MLLPGYRVNILTVLLYVQAFYHYIHIKIYLDNTDYTVQKTLSVYNIQTLSTHVPCSLFNALMLPILLLIAALIGQCL